MFWNDRRVVVTGASGFIGSHLTERLLEEGALVRAVVHGDPLYKSGFLADSTHPHLERVGGDIQDATFVNEALAGVDTVFHLAAVTSVAYSYQHPEETMRTNTLGTMHVCAAALKNKVRRLVHTSTAGAYGNAKAGLPISEDHPVAACNPYAAGKLGGDHIVESYYRSYDLPVTTTRLFNVYGPRMGRFLIMPTIILQLLKSPELHLGDLSPVRPFCYIDDIVAAYMAMATAPEVLGEVVHFGALESIRMADLVDKIADLMDRPYHLKTDADRMRPKKSEIYAVHVNSEKAQRLVQWRPETSLEEGLTKTIAWMKAGGYG